MPDKPKKIGTAKFSGSITGFKQLFVKGGGYQVTIQTRSDPSLGALLLKGTEHGECPIQAVIDLEEGQLEIPYDEEGDGQQTM